MTKAGYPNLETLCRLCLTSKKDDDNDMDMLEIFARNNAVEQKLSVPMRIMSLGLEVHHNDDLPKLICGDCRYSLEKSYYFRKRSQAADSKLRKHLRLLSLGKKSRIFSKTSEEDFEDELDFEDSLEFIKCQKELREAKKQDEQKKWQDNLQAEMHAKLESFKEDYREEQKKAEIVLREKMRGELQLEIRDDLEQELREALRDEYTEEAKTVLRDELKVECRQEEMQTLLSDLEDYLRLKRAKSDIKEEKSKALAIKTTTPLAPKIVSSTDAIRVRKGSSLTDDTPIKLQKLHLENTLQRNYNETLPSTTAAATEHFQMIAAENIASDAAAGSEENITISRNYYILESDNLNDDEDTIDSHEEDHADDGESSLYASNEVEDENFHLTAADSGEHSRSLDMRLYKNSLDENVEIARDQDGDVIVLHFEQKPDEAEEIETVEYVNIVNDDNADVRKLTKNTIFSKFLSKNNVTDSLALLPQRSTDTPKTFKCASCHMAFSTENTLRRHRRTHVRMQINGVSFQCPDCQIYLSCKSALTRHMIIHTGMRPHACTYCGKAFAQKEILKRHLLSHTGERPHKCPHCNRSFTQKVNLTQHINKNHTDLPNRQQHPCHLCPKSFFHASGLSRHLASHGGVTFQCTKCERSFGDRSSVKRHVANVHGEGNVDKVNRQCKDDEENEIQNSDENSIELFYKC